MSAEITNYQYRTDERGFKEILGSSNLANAMVSIASPAMYEAVATAPHDTGAFAGGFSIRPALVPAGRKGELRAGAEITNKVPYARYVMDSEKSQAFMKSLAQRIGGEEV